MTRPFTPRAIQPGELLLAGDILLSRNDGLFAALIRWGTRTGRGGINHAGVIVLDQEAAGSPVRTVEAVASGVVESVRKDLTGYVVRITDNREEAARIVEAASSFLGTPYDWVGIGRFAVICLRARWWGKPLARILSTALPKQDDHSRVFCSDHISQTLTKVYGDLGLGPSYTVAPVDLLRYLIGYGTHIDGSNPNQ